METILVVAIVGFISAQIFASFSGLNQASILKRSAQELSFNIRRAQNMALAVAPVKIGAGGCAPEPTPCIPKSVGIRLTRSKNDTLPSPLGNGIPDNEEYFFFADQNKNRIYNDPGERIEPSTFLPNGIRITSITGTSSGHPEAHIIFYTPEARVRLTKYNGGPVNPSGSAGFMDVTLTAPSGDTITVRIGTSGQVSVL